MEYELVNDKVYCKEHLRIVAKAHTMLTEEVPYSNIENSPLSVVFSSQPTVYQISNYQVHPKVSVKFADPLSFGAIVSVTLVEASSCEELIGTQF